MEFMRFANTAIAAAIGLSLVASGARAQHEHEGDMAIGASADGTGDLLIEYDFDTITRTDFAGNVGPFSLYSSTNPGFLAAADEPDEGVFELDAGTEVELSIVALEADLQVQVGAVVMDSAGDSAVLGTHDGIPGDDGALHGHPTFRLILDAPEGEFGEGSVSFQLLGDGPYGSSETYTMQVSNGYLPEPAAAEPKDGAACQKAVAGQVGKLLGKTHKNVARCLDAVQSFKAAGGDLMSPSGSVLNKCSTDPTKGLVAKIAADRLGALEKAADKCVGSLEEVQISTHLGMAVCRTQELISAGYPSALEDLAVVMFGDDEEAAKDAFPCIEETQGETEDLD
jgi:hypothetical protein